MSTEFPPTWREALKKAGITSYGQLAERADLPKPTVWAAITGRSKSYKPTTVAGLARALRMSEKDVTEALGMGRQSIHAYTPPAEADYLDTRQRAAVDEMIRLLAQANTQAEDDTQEDSTSDPVAYSDAAFEKLARLDPDDWRKASSPHEQPDPHNDVGEESQDK